jgi:hypothetical protein
MDVIGAELNFSVAVSNFVVGPDQVLFGTSKTNSYLLLKISCWISNTISKYRN